jgi:hypothetical protein
MTLNWKDWSYDLFRSVIRSMCVAFTVWGGYSIKYEDVNFRDLVMCLAIAGVLRGVMAFLETRPLPEDLDVVKETKPGEKESK